MYNMEQNRRYVTMKQNRRYIYQGTKIVVT